MGSWFKKHFYLVFFGIFAFVGTIMGICAAYFWLNKVKMTNEGVHTMGTVVELVSNGHGNYAPKVEFRLKNGAVHSYTSNTFSSPPSYREGEYVELWYNPANPDEAILAGIDSWLLPLIFGIFFLVFGGIGYGGFMYQWMKRRDVKWLEQNGQSVEATLTGVRLKNNVKMNGASPYVIQCQWMDKSSNKMYVFESDYIWYDPSEFVHDKKIRVLIDPKDPGMYTVDISFLPEAG